MLLYDLQKYKSSLYSHWTQTCYCMIFKSTNLYCMVNWTQERNLQHSKTMLQLDVTCRPVCLLSVQGSRHPVTIASDCPVTSSVSRPSKMPTAPPTLGTNRKTTSTHTHHRYRQRHRQRDTHTHTYTRTHKHTHTHTHKQTQNPHVCPVQKLTGANTCLTKIRPFTVKCKWKLERIAVGPEPHAKTFPPGKYFQCEAQMLFWMGRCNHLICI